MPIKFPITKVTNAGKYAFCYRVQEALRLRHNEQSRRYKNKDITEKEFKAWIVLWFEPRQQAIIEVLLALRTVIKDDNPRNIDVEDVIQI